MCAIPTNVYKKANFYGAMQVVDYRLTHSGNDSGVGVYAKIAANTK